MRWDLWGVLGFDEVIRVGPHDGISGLRRKGRVSLHMHILGKACEHIGEGAVCKLGRESYQESNHTGCLILDFQLSEL